MPSDEDVSSVGGRAILEEEFGEDLELTDGEEPDQGRQEEAGPSTIGLSQRRNYSTSQLFTPSVQKYFARACLRYASRQRCDRMAEYANSRAWKGGTAPKGIRTYKAVDMAWRCNLLEAASAMVQVSTDSRHWSSKRAKVTSEQRLQEEQAQAEELCAQEERDARLVDNQMRQGTKNDLPSILLDSDAFGERARELLASPDAVVTRASLEEFTAILVTWTRRVVWDALRYEEERRWGKAGAVKNPMVQMSSLNAALSRHGIPPPDDSQDQEDASL